MSNNNNPPFVVGQEVVCIKATSDFSHINTVKGRKYVVLGIKKDCCNWAIDVNISTDVDYVTCSTCFQRYKTDGYRWFRADRFAPVTRITRTEVVEVAETIKELDKCLN